jgi:FkbM family methyltransferase
MGANSVTLIPEIFTDLPTWDKRRETTAAFLNEKNRRRLIFGCTEIGRKIASMIDIDGFIDDITIEHEYANRPVIRSGEILTNDLILSTITGIKPISASIFLASTGAKHVDYFAFKKLSSISVPNIPFWQDPEIDIADHSSVYREIYDNLSDTESRLTFHRITNFRQSYDLSEMRDFTDRQEVQYFEPFLELNSHLQIFLDIGAFDGFSSKLFSNLYPEYKEIHSFEPNPVAFLQTEKALADLRDCHLYNFGASNSFKKVLFSNDGSASKESDQGSLTVSLKPFDDVLNIKPTFVKMDIEGGELNALQGMTRIRSESRPALALACYHYPSQMRELYQECRRVEKHFRLFLRHYTEGTTETVLFVLPT